MRTLKIVILTKSTEKRELLFQYISKCYPNSRIFMEDPGANMCKYTSTSQEPIDICFTEVLEADPYGLEIAESFRDICPKTKIVFISDVKDFALKAWELGVKDYLLEPITIESIQHTVVSCS